MQGEPPTRASTPTGAVFLSYASQDAESAQRICAALRSAGVEVWFDQSELRGGDVWDQKIRQQIRDCTLFIPVVSVNTASRREGYFRLEWDLADQRSHMMARDTAFIVPVSLAATPGAGTDVPDSFHRVQWLRLPDGQTSPAFIEHVRRLLSPEVSTGTQPPVRAVSGAGPVITEPARTSRASMLVLLATVAVVAAVLAYFVADKFWFAKHLTPAAAAFAPPPHSIAVLPFVNLSGDKEQEYFSDGLTEELLNSLARIDELHVAARTSSFVFKGQHADIGAIARKLNVAAVLEGSVRKSAGTVRIGTQLIDAVSGFHLWSQTYDRSLGDVLALQTEIADAVTGALRVKLLGGSAARVELGTTRNPRAFDAYLRGLRLERVATNAQEWHAPVDAYTEAIGFDPNYPLAYARRSLVLWNWASHYAANYLQHPEFLTRARADAERAIALAPGLGEGHIALANVLESGTLEFARAKEECARGLAVAPGNSAVLVECSRMAAHMGQTDVAISAARRGVALDPLNPLSHRVLGDVLVAERRFQEANEAYQDSIAVDPEHAVEGYARRGLTYYLLGDVSMARTSCEAKPDFWESWICLAITYHKLGRRADAAAMFARALSTYGDAGAYQFTQIHAQWGERGTALDWLDKAVRLHDGGLVYAKTDPLLDPLRKEPRFQAIERELKFPQ